MGITSCRIGVQRVKGGQLPFITCQMHAAVLCSALEDKTPATPQAASSITTLGYIATW